MKNRRFKRGIAPVAAVLILCLTAVGQVGPVEKVDLEMIKKIRDEGLERSQVMDTLSWVTDVIGARLTGSPGLKAANEWTKKRLTEWGLENARLEAWGPFGRGWSFDKVSAQVIEPTPFPIIAYPEAWTPGTNGPVTSEVVLVDVKSEADFANYKGKLRGKFVMVGPPREVKAWFKAPGERLSDEDLLRFATDEERAGRQYPPDAVRTLRERAQILSKLNAFFKEEGVRALLRLSRAGDGGTVFVQSGGPREPNAPEVLPSVVVAAEHYGRMARILQKGIPVKMELNVSAKFHDQDLMGYNTVAEIPGGDKKNELVMLGGHLDSWHAGTGATDNAAGISVAMEAVRILKALGVKPRRTIRIALWTGEEQGLLGSRAYVTQHFAENQVPPGAPPAGPGGGPVPPVGNLVTKADYDNLSAYFNLDNGTGKIRGVYLQGNDAVRSIFRAWLAPFRDLGAATLTIHTTGGTDHLSFDRVGLPGFQFIQDPVEYDTRTHHSNMDLYDRLQADDMKQASVIMAAFVYQAAMRDERLPRKPKPPAAETARQ
ncbi:MAG TPA: M20/M25/M40 family metallo-hydrolase [Blastocatellia bacterium]|nr:M20/M25/M40 family metallo-hydrolase [Blastocatellia bacterium]